MIFLCPKALSSKDGEDDEREFLKYYLSKSNKRAKLTNEVWETFRYKTIDGSGTNKEGAYELIAEFRGIFEPEILKLDGEFQEIEATQDYSIEKMRESVNSFLIRNWADIDIFITQEKEKYNEVCDKYNIRIMNLSEFFLDFMDNDGGRSLLESYWVKKIHENYN